MTISINPLVTCEQLSMRFGQLEVLRNINLEIDKGEFVAIVGASGCGKSTLLRLIAGLEEPSSGSLKIGNKIPKEARKAQQNLAFVFQDATLLPWRTVEQNVALPLNLNTLPSTQSLSVAKALDMVGLTNFAKAYPRQLSGGMKMRTSIARALLTHPELLLMDEPFGALDEMTRQRLNEELLNLWSQVGWSCVFITHNIQEAVFLSQRILVMGHGQWLADIPVALPYPRDPDIRTSPEFNAIAAEASHYLRESHA